LVPAPPQALSSAKTGTTSSHIHPRAVPVKSVFMTRLRCELKLKS
jgi:hypothetical protein